MEVRAGGGESEFARAVVNGIRSIFRIPVVFVLFFSEGGWGRARADTCLNGWAGGACKQLTEFLTDVMFDTISGEKGERQTLEGQRGEWRTNDPYTYRGKKKKNEKSQVKNRGFWSRSDWVEYLQHAFMIGGPLVRINEMYGGAVWKR
eukprot:1375039-Amorphochlora_amoeboformis.AAC.1